MLEMGRCLVCGVFGELKLFITDGYPMFECSVLLWELSEG